MLKNTTGGTRTYRIRYKKKSASKYRTVKYTVKPYTVKRVPTLKGLAKHSTVTVKVLITKGKKAGKYTTSLRRKL